MLKTTIMRIKRAFTLTIVPRTLRGDISSHPQKFKKLSLGGIRKAGKSTKAGSLDNGDKCNKCKKIIELAFGTTTQAHKDTANKIKVFNLRNDTNKLQKQNVMQFADKGDEKEVIAKAGDSEKETNTLIELEMGNNDKYNENNRQKGKPIYIITEDSYAKECKRNKNEEKLEQKIEKVEEITQIDTINTKVEGFNSPLKMLSDEAPTVSNNRNKTLGKSDSDISITLDEIAKRCLNSPSNKIDEQIIKEIKSLGVPNVGLKEAPTTADNNLVQADPLKIPLDPVKFAEIKINNTELQNNVNTNKGREQLSSTSLRQKPGLEESKSSDDSSSQKPTHTQIYTYNNKPMFGPDYFSEQEIISHPQREVTEKGNTGILGAVEQSQVIIDPCDKKTTAHNTEEFGVRSVWDSRIVHDEKINGLSNKKKNQVERYKTIPFSLNEAYPVPAQSLTQPVLAVDPNEKDEEGRTNYLDNSIPKMFGQKPFPSFEAREEICETSKQNILTCSHLKGSGSSLISEPDSVLPNRSGHLFNYIQPAVDANSEDVQKDDMKALYDPVYTTQVAGKKGDTLGPNSSEESNSHLREDFCKPKVISGSVLPEAVAGDRNNNSDTPASTGPLPKLNSGGEVSLSELLRRVRERNRLEYCGKYELRNVRVHVTVVDPLEGKCGKKTPPCPPPAPKCPPPSQCPPPSTPCPPPPPPCPKPCKPACPPPCPPPCPPKKSPCNKFENPPQISLRDSVVVLMDLRSDPRPIHRRLLKLILCSLNDFTDFFNTKKAVLTNEVVIRLSYWTRNLFIHQKAVCSTLTLARGFEPWTPIPSWPVPKKEKKKPFVCPKEGCKVVPPPKLGDPCSGHNPCLNFPKRSNFSRTIFV